MLPAGIVLLAALALYASTATRTITASFGGTDGGELAAVALSGGVAHPPGYPTYLLLARASLLLPWDEPAARLALLSALCGALAASLTALLIATTAPGGSQAAGWIAGVYAGLVLMLCERLWSQALIVEVYTLHLACLTLLTLLLRLWIATGRSRLLLLAAYLLGLGLGVHLTLAALIPAGIVAWLVAPQRPRVTTRLGLGAVGAMAAGLAVYGLLPLWALREAVPSWGDPRTAIGFWRQISAAEYRYLLGAVPWAQRGARLGYVARDLLAQPGPLGLLFAIGWGLAAGWRCERPLLALSGGVALGSLLFAIGYGGADSSVYLLPWTWAWCVWAGLGVAVLWQRLAGPWLRAGLAVLLALTLSWTLATRYQRLDLHAERAERERVAGWLRSLPPAAIVFTSADADTFGGWYLQQAFATRRDVLIVDTRLLRWPWYRRQLVVPLAVPEQRSICRALQTSARPRYRVDPSGVAPAVESAFDPAICAAK
jgi:hypothetical protein